MAWTITVGGVDITTYVDVDSLEVEESAGQGERWRALCRFEARDHTGTIDVDEEDEVSITEDGTDYFTGKVKQVEETVHGLTRVWTCTAVSWGCLLDEVVIDYYTIDEGDDDDVEIGTIFSTYCSDIDGSTYVAQLETGMPLMALTALTLRDAMEDICEVTGGAYWVDWGQNLHYVDPAFTSVHGSGWSDDPDGIVTFGYSNFKRYKASDRLAKRFFILGTGSGVSGWVTGGTYSAGDPEGVVRDPSVTTVAQRNQRGNALLEQYESTRSTVEFDTRWDGFNVGEQYSFANTTYSISGSLFVTGATWRFLSKDANTREFHVTLDVDYMYEFKWDRQVMARLGQLQSALIAEMDEWPAATAEGDLLVADATSSWAILSTPGSAGYALVSTATTEAWAQEPTWTGRHSWNDGGGVTAYVDEDGSADFSGHVAVGGGASVSGAIILNVDEDVTANSGTYYGVASRVRLNPTAGFSTVAIGYSGGVDVETAQTASGVSVYGVEGVVRGGNGVDARSITISTGLRGQIDVEDMGSGGGYGVLLGMGAYLSTPAVDTGVCTNGYGAYIDQGVVGAGSISGQLFGIYIAEMNEGTAASWSIYSDGGDSYHEDRLKVGGNTTISAQFHVDQSSPTGGQAVVRLDQGDVDEDVLQVQSDGADRDLYVLRLNVTGSPLLWWDESENSWVLTDELLLSEGDLHLASGLGIVHADGVAAGSLLVGNGARYVPGTLGDIGGAPDDARYVVLALDGDLSAERVLTAGDGLALTDGGANGNATLAVDLVGAWSGLEFSGGNLRVDLDAVYAWAGAHYHSATVIMDDNVGNSPAFQLVGGSNNDTAVVYLVDNAVAGDSDLAVALPAADSGARLLIQTSAYATVAWIDATGDADFSDLTLDEYIVHDGDVDTYIRFQADRVTLRAGGVDLVDVVEGATDYVAIGGEFYVGASSPDSRMSPAAYVEDGVLGLSYSGGAANVQPFTYSNDTADFSRWGARKARGTRGSPSAAQNGDILSRFGGGGYGATGFPSQSTGWFQVVAGQNMTDAAMGTYASVWTTPDGSTSPAEAGRWTENGVYRAMDSVYINESSNGEQGLGLTINQGANDDEIVSLKSSDVAHGITDITETDTYGLMQKINGGDGGLDIRGLSEATRSLQLSGYGDTDDTGKTTGDNAYVEIRAGLKSGTNAGAAGADANLVGIFNWTTLRFIFDAEGSAHSDVEWTTFDGHDDLALLDSLEGGFGEFAEGHRRELEGLGIVHYDERGGHGMVNWTRLSMLLVGALRQVGGRLERLEQGLIAG